MKTNIELDTKILNKNLEITKLTTQLDNLTSEYVDLKDRMKSPFILTTINECHDIFVKQEQTYHDTYGDGVDTSSSENLRKDLRKVISFLQNPTQYNTR